MKKLLVFLFSLAALNAKSQTRYHAKDFFSEKNISWYGIDYSKARFIGSFGQFKDAGAIDEKTLVDKYFKVWNDVIVHEPKKYDLVKFLNKESVYNDLKPVQTVNSTTKPDGIMIENDYSLNSEEIPAMVKKYKGGDKKEGIGVVFITESYNHNKEVGSYYVVVFDIASKQTLISEKYSFAPGGFGIKSYWISTAHKTLEQVSKDYDQWKQKYGK